MDSKVWPSPPFVLVWVPFAQEGDRLVSPSFDTPQAREELGAAFAALGLDWAWEPVTLENLPASIERAAAVSRKRPVVVLNLCDGTELDGYPGLRVVQALEHAGLPYTGARPRYYELSTYKTRMKDAFVAAGVPTPPYAAIADPQHDVAGLCARLGVPLLVKPDVSSASAGLTLRSVVCDDRALAEQVAALYVGRHGVICPTMSSVFVERFIPGREFTVLVVGSARPGGQLRIYAPVERVFHSQLPELERFLSYERYWGLFQEETPLPPDEPFYYYALVEGPLREELCDLASSAYAAVDGGGYGRVDIRQDRASGALYVLEVNANCGLSGDDQTSTGQILALTGTRFEELLENILAGARSSRAD